MLILEGIIHFILTILFVLFLILGFLTVNGLGFLIVGSVGIILQYTFYYMPHKKRTN